MAFADALPTPAVWLSWSTPCGFAKAAPSIHASRVDGGTSGASGSRGTPDATAAVIEGDDALGLRLLESLTVTP